MAKGGLLGGMLGGGAGPTRPVPRPDMGAAAMAQPQPQQAGRNGFPSMFSRGVGGILPERGSEMQNEIVNSLVQAALQSAPNSGSPLLAALAPMLGGAAMSRANGLREIGQQREQDGMASTVFGRPMSDSERQLMEIMGNEGAPGFVRSEAERQLTAALRGGGSGGGGGGGGGGRGTTGAPVSGPGGAPVEPVDEMTLLLEATSGGGGLLTEPQRRTMFTMLRNPDATSQSRQLAQELLERHDAAIRQGVANPEGLPAAPNVPTSAPQAPMMPTPPNADPAAPWWRLGSAGSTPNVPPPPPGTVPF